MSHAIDLRNLSFTYLGSAVEALSNVTLSIGSGELVVVMGATGAGKSTLAKCLNRTIPTFHAGTLTGDITILGEAMIDQGVADLAGSVGLVSQDFEAQLFATNVIQEIVFGMEQLGVDPAQMRQRVQSALQMVGLVNFETRDPSTLSGGEKQRLAIAATLALEPKILVFDEPTTDLDPAGKLEVFGVLAAMRQRGYTIVLIEHESRAADFADRLLVMSKGRIVGDGPPRDILARVAFLEEHGIRPPDLSRIATAAALATVPSSCEEAAAALRQRYPQAPRPFPAQSIDRAEAPLLEASAVDYTYDSGKPALRGVSLSIRRGEFVALIGQNGSGKTTLAKHLNGLLKPTSGSVRLRGTDIRTLPLSTVAADVGYVFQNPDHQIFAASVFEEVAFGPRNLGVQPAEVEERVRDVLAVVGLAELAEEDPFLLSKGQRQRLAVASLLALRPTLLILDEPTTGLDYVEQRRMMELIARLRDDGMTFLMITHSPWVVAEYAERGVLMRSGAIVFDGPLRELFAKEELLASTRFRVPEATQVGLRLGFTPLSVDELVGALESSNGTVALPS